MSTNDGLLILTKVMLLTNISNIQWKLWTLRIRRFTTKERSLKKRIFPIIQKKAKMIF